MMRRALTTASPCRDHAAALRHVASGKGEDAKLAVLGPDDSSHLDDCGVYTRCWMNKYGTVDPSNNIVLRPSTTESVSAFLEYANDKGLVVVPQGGNTGLVGAGVPVSDTSGEVIMSLSRMKGGMHLDEEEAIFQCNAGVTLEQAQVYCAEKGFVFPVDLGAKGSCMVGGNLNTNAGGIYFNRFGSIRSNLMGLEAVLADGKILSTMSPLMRKSSLGFDLSGLFVGSEGTLGVVTKVAMKVHRKPTTRDVAVLSCSDFFKVRELQRRCDIELGSLVSCVEFMDNSVLKLVEENLGSSITWSLSSKYYVLVETMGFDGVNDSLALAKFLESALDDELVEDGVLAQDATQIAKIWAVRESCGVAVNKSLRSWKYDLSLKLSDWEEVSQLVADRVGPAGGKVALWGHLGDRNVHLNVVSETERDLTDLLEPFVYEETFKRKGSISAEHGVGMSKGAYMSRAAGDDVYKIMKKVKAVFDPNNIMNTGAGKMFTQCEREEIQPK